LSRRRHRRESRCSTRSAWCGRCSNATGGIRWLEVRRDHDELRRLVRIVDPNGNDALGNVYDL
jgi:hypothetical protein